MATVSNCKTMDDFWSQEIDRQGREGWYGKSLEYWDKQEASVNGVLGGYGHTSGQDLRESKRLLMMLKGRTDLGLKFESVLDCGAGIGRISEGLLLREFKNVDLLEPCEKLIAEARNKLHERVRRFYKGSLQDFEFAQGGGAACVSYGECLVPAGSKSEEPLREDGTSSSTTPSPRHLASDDDDNAASDDDLAVTAGTGATAPPTVGTGAKESRSSCPECLAGSDRAEEPPALEYDCIWNQWVLLYLTDDDLLAYLQKCQRALSAGGFIFVKENVLVEPPAKENVSNTEEWISYKRGCEVDEEDNGLTRSDAQYRKLFKQAGLQLICAVRQTNWPEGLYPLYMYVVR